MHAVHEPLHLLLDSLRLNSRIIHLAPHPFLQLFIAHTLNALFAIHARFLRSSNDAHSNNDTDISYAGDFGVQPTLVDFRRGEGGAERGSGGIDHGLRYFCCFGEDGAETDAGEDVHVVACRSLVSMLSDTIKSESNRDFAHLVRGFQACHCARLHQMGFRLQTNICLWYT